MHSRKIAWFCNQAHIFQGKSKPRRVWISHFFPNYPHCYKSCMYAYSTAYLTRVRCSFFTLLERWKTRAYKAAQRSTYVDVILYMCILQFILAASALASSGFFRYRMFQGFALWWYLHFKELFKIDCKKTRKLFFLQKSRFFCLKPSPDQD